MNTIESVKKLYKDNNLINENSQVFYGFLDIKKSNLNKLNILVKSNKEKYICSIGASNKDFVIIPYNNLNKEFSLDQKVIYELENITKVIINKILLKYYISIYLNEELLIRIIFEKRHLKNIEFYKNIINFIKRFNYIDKAKILKDERKLTLENKKNNLDLESKINLKEQNLSKNLANSYCFSSTIIPSTLLKDPTSSPVQFQDSFKGQVQGNSDYVLILNNKEEIKILNKRIHNVIVRSLEDKKEVEILIESNNECLFKIILTNEDLANRNLKDNIKIFINSFFHSGTDIDSIKFVKSKKNNSLLKGLIWYLILILIILGVIFLLKD